MSFRSGFNTDLVINNLRVNGALTLANPLDVSSIEVQTLVCEGKASISDLDVSGQSTLTDLSVSGQILVEDLFVTGQSELTELSVSGSTELTSLNVTGQTDLNNVYISGTATVTDIHVTGNSALNTVNANGNIIANSQTITPTQLGYVSGATSSLQNQINAKANTASPTFTGTVTLPTTQSNGYMYYVNTGTANEIDYGSQYFGAIGSNATGGNAEMDFINMGLNASNQTLSAFDWYILTSSTAKKLLLRLYNSGALLVEGLLTANTGISTTTLTTSAGISTTTLTATGHSQLVDVSSNNMTVTGNLNVMGQITSATPSNMELVTYNLTGNASSVSQTLTLKQNTTNTTNYAVFPAVYYGYSGSGGTYNAINTAGNITPIVISNRTTSSFVFNMNKGSGDNINVWLTFLVVYNISGTNYPVSN